MTNLTINVRVEYKEIEGISIPAIPPNEIESTECDYIGNCDAVVCNRIYD